MNVKYIPICKQICYMHKLIDGMFGQQRRLDMRYTLNGITTKIAELLDEPAIITYCNKLRKEMENGGKN